MLDDNWHQYLAFIPEKEALCSFYRESYGGISSEKTGEWVGYAKDFSPEFNISNLYWRYTGIGREQLGWPCVDEMYNYIRTAQQANMNWVNANMSWINGALGLLGNRGEFAANSLGNSKSIL